MFQKVSIIGNLGRDPEMKFLPNGTPVTTFSVATSEKWTGKDGEKNELTTWFRVSVFGKQAETVSQYLHKGSKVYAEGRLSADPATGGPKIWSGQDGNPRTSFELRADVVKFLSSKSEGGEDRRGATVLPTDASEDEVPF